jgi:hypothetical protein
LSENIKNHFNEVIPTLRPTVEDQAIKNLNWVAGFVTGEGCFSIEIYKSKASKLGGTSFIKI